VPKLLHSQKKTVGIRVPNHGIPRAIVEALGHPILSSSLPLGDEDPLEYSTDPELIFEKYQHEVDLVIDGGYGGLIPSTVLDCTGDEVVCLREGLGDFQDLL
jgi:tRNA threonylcarbamoyl adenosine modification protein (Sua5/YciO/YrdC/YwlC family)